MTKHLSTTTLEEEETVDASEVDGNASIPEQFERLNPWRNTMMMMMMMMIMIIRAAYFGPLAVIHSICSKISLKMAIQLGRNP